MIYALFGTHKNIREKANKEFAALGAVTRYVYSEHASELESFIDAKSLFGDVVIVSCVSLGDVASSKEVLVRLLPQMESSSNIFIVDEAFADTHLVNKILKVAKKSFDAREEKVKDTSVFALCDSFARRDKKQAWIDFNALKNKGEGEAIAGALWWKFQTVWGATLEGKKTAFTVQDCERIGKEITSATILAHRGERDLMIELERIIVSL